MTTERGRMAAFKAIVERQQPGGYTLPAAVLDAYEMTAKVVALTVEPAAPYLHDVTAADVLDTITRGEPVDVTALGAQVRRSVDAAADVEHANRVLVGVVEKAQYRALGVIQVFADTIVVDHLRPTYEDTLKRAHRDAAALAGHATDAGSVITASTKVRSAWASLRDAGNRYHLLREVWRLTNTAGLRIAEHDTQGQFATFAEPSALFPGRPAGTARMPQLPFPSEPVDLMLWLVGDAATARPWLPTTDEQDAAWNGVYGEQHERLRVGHDNVQAIAGR